MTMTDGIAIGSTVPDRERREILGHLAAGVAHELNNWFFVIRGFSELARLDIDDGDPVAESLDRIEEAIDIAEGLTRMVLECAHPSGDGVIAIRLHPHVKECLKLVRATLPETISVHQDIASDAPLADLEPVRFFTAVLSLLQTAIASIDKRGGMLWVKLAETEADGESAGPGVALSVGSASGAEAEDLLKRLDAGEGTTPPLLREDDEAAVSMNELVRGFGGTVRYRSIDEGARCIDVTFPAVSNAKAR